MGKQLASRPDSALHLRLALSKFQMDCIKTSSGYFGLWVILLLASTTVSGEPIREPLLHERQGWKSSLNYRGTWELLVTCLSTVFLCCWTAYHPDICRPSSPGPQRYLDRTVRNFLVGITFPEVYLYIAFYENLDAGDALKNMSEKLATQWTTTHGYYANSGGFAIEYSVQEEPQNNAKRCVYLTAPTARWLLERGRIDPRTFPSREEIQDKSKSDSIANVITILHITWFLAQCVGRLCQRLPLTTLEVSTAAYIPCALFAYILWWNKPYEVTVPTVLHLLPDLSKSTVLVAQAHGSNPAKGLCKHWRQVETRRLLGTLNTNSFAFPAQEYRTYEITRQCGEIVRSSVIPVGVYGFSSALVFFIVGGIHLAAWNFDFLSISEQCAWRVCSFVIATIIPISWVLTALLLKASTGFWWDGSECKEKLDQYRTMRWVAMSIQGVAIVVYAFARLYLIVEVFAGLRGVPAGVYQTPEWSDYLPRVG